MIKYILIISVVLLSLSAYSQNDMQISNYMFFNSQYNPSFTGQTKSINAGILEREQWTGMKQAPATQVLNADMWFPVGGLGISVLNDRLGFEHSLRINGTYAYHYRFTNKLLASGGVGLGVINKSIDGASLVYVNQNDINAITTNISEYKLNLDFGASVIYDKLLVGVSLTHLNKSVNTSDFAAPPRHFWVYSRYVYTLNETIKLLPSVLIKSSIYKTQFELNTNCLIKDKYWGGLSFRWNESIVSLIGMQINKFFKVGYSYDFPVGPIKGNSYGNHEIFLIYSIDRKFDVPLFDNSPRYL